MLEDVEDQRGSDAAVGDRQRGGVPEDPADRSGRSLGQGGRDTGRVAHDIGPVRRERIAGDARSTADVEDRPVTAACVTDQRVIARTGAGNSQSAMTRQPEGIVVVVDLAIDAAAVLVRGSVEQPPRCGCLPLGNLHVGPHTLDRPEGVRHSR